jgi:hypothetical protein
MALIVIFIGVDSVTLRNVGVLGAALSIALTTFQKSESTPRVEVGSVEPAFDSVTSLASRIA